MGEFRIFIPAVDRSNPCHVFGILAVHTTKMRYPKIIGKIGYWLDVFQINFQVKYFLNFK